MCGLPGVGAAAGAGIQFALQKRQNDAYADAANAEAVAMTRKAIDDRIIRSRMFEEYRGAQRARASALGGPQALPATSENTRDEINQAAADATLDVMVISDELKDRMEALRARLKSQTKSPFLAAAEGAVQGYQIGSMFKGGSGGVKPENPSGGSTFRKPWKY